MLTQHSMLFRLPQDITVLKCNQCQIEFGITILRYNCRKCDQLFCSDCTKNRLLIPKEDILKLQRSTSTGAGVFGSSYHHLLSLSTGAGGRGGGIEEQENEYYRCPQRVCYTCYFTLRDKQNELRQVVSRANQENSLTSEITNLPGVNFQLDREIQKAANILYTLQSSVGGEVIPKSLLNNARGVVFFTIIKVGFLVTGRYGTGLVIARLNDGSWSAPSAVQMSGLGWGIQVGAELNNVMLILSTDTAVNIFKSTTQFALGAELGVSVGPIGRSVEGGGTASKSGVAHAYSYAQSKGLFVGVSVEASGIASRPDVNLEFYGEQVTSKVLLSGNYMRPKSAAILYQALRDVMHIPSIEAVDDDIEFEWTKSVDTDTPITATITTATNTSSSSSASSSSSSSSSQSLLYDEDTVEL